MLATRTVARTLLAAALALAFGLPTAARGQAAATPEATVAKHGRTLTARHVKGLGNDKTLKSLLRDPLAAYLRDRNGATLLHHAVTGGHLSAIALLLKAGALTEARDREGSTPLALAVVKENEPVVRALLDGKASPNAADARGNTPLLLAARAGQTEILRLLVRNGGVVVRDKDVEAGKTEADKALLRTAARLLRYRWAHTWKRTEDMAAVLVQARADADFGAALRLDAIGMAIWKDDPDELAKLVTRHTSMHGDGTNPNYLVEWAVLTQSPRAMAWLLENPLGGHPNERSWAMAKAMALRQPQTIAFLIKHGAPPPEPAALDGFPPALRAELLPLARDREIYGGWNDRDYDLSAIVGKIAAGAPPPLPKKPGDPPDLRYLLLAKRPLPPQFDPDQRDAAGCSLLHYAAAGGNEPAMRMLLAKSTIAVNDSKCLMSYLQPMDLALRAKAPAVAFLLLDRGATPTSRALHMAIQYDLEKVALALARRLPKEKPEDYLADAVRHDMPELVGLALAAKPVDLTNKPGCRLAESAATAGAPAVLSLLLDKGARPDGSCGSLLKFALWREQHLTAELLAKRGADPSVDDWEPLRYALKQGARAVVRELAARNPQVAAKAREMELEAAAGGFVEYLDSPKKPSACLTAAGSPEVVKQLAKIPGATAGASLENAITLGNFPVIRALLAAGVRATVKDAQEAFHYDFARDSHRGASQAKIFPDLASQQQTLALIPEMLRSRTWSGVEMDELLALMTGPHLYPSPLFTEVLRARRKLPSPPRPEALARIAAHATGADLKLFLAAYPTVPGSDAMWKAATAAGNDAMAELHLKTHAPYPRATQLEYLKAAMYWKLPRTARLLLDQIGTVPPEIASAVLVWALEKKQPEVARVLLSQPGALGHEQVIRTALDPDRVWLTGLLLDLGAADPKGLGLEALLKPGLLHSNDALLVKKLLARGLSVDSMLRNAGKLEHNYGVAEYFLATLPPLDAKDADGPMARAMSDLASALAARKGGLRLLSDLVERLGAPLNLEKAGGYGSLPMWSAIKEGDVEVVRYLLDKGAATTSGCSEAIDLLPERKAPGKQAVKALLEGAGIRPNSVCD
jgi:ankyrin repeat protein